MLKDRLNICVIGKVNVGKSTIINKIIGQDVSIVSDTAGTTTDPVSKRYEFIPIGKVNFFDTPGYDDTSILGNKRVNATNRIIFKSDIVILVFDNNGLTDIDKYFLEQLQTDRINFLLLFNDKKKSKKDSLYLNYLQQKNINFSTIKTIKNDIINLVKSMKREDSPLIKDLLKQGDLVLLVIPQDSSAPKGRIILPQVAVLRELLENNYIVVCTNEKELKNSLKELKQMPDLVITDSQVLALVIKTVPENINLTTFSIIMSRFKGEFDVFLKGVKQLKKIDKNDRILIAEACSHNTTHEDIAKTKLPLMLNNYLNFQPQTFFTSGGDFPENIKDYSLVIHCGGCMLNRTELKRRIEICQKHKVSITNYGMVISEMNNNLERTIKIFKR
jgi:[FeFe] hydrogenase H-cluster maturation GTPase HydF